MEIYASGYNPNHGGKEHNKNLTFNPNKSTYGISEKKLEAYRLVNLYDWINNWLILWWDH